MYLYALVYNLRTDSQSQVPLLKPDFTYFQFNINSREASSSKEEHAHIYFNEKDLSNEVQEVQVTGSSVPDTVKLTLSGRPTEEAVSTSDTSDWAEQLISLTQPKCIYQTHLPLDSLALIQANGDDAVHLADKYNWHIHVNHRTPVTDEEAFCGTGTYRHRYDILRIKKSEDFIDLRDYPHLCFAYKGSTYKNYVQVLFGVTRSDGK